jgi:very-short-patch-repair endonuclease
VSCTAVLPRRSPPPLEDACNTQLTLIEAPFYDALRETDLTFAVQSRVQGPDQVYRPDFIVFYGGLAVVVELDGHEGHKTRAQRSHDAARQRWFEERGLRVIRWTGSQVWADAKVCVAELLSVLRGAASRP